MSEQWAKHRADGGRTMGEQNIYWNTDVYVQGAQGRETKGVGGLLEGQMGLDKV